MKEVSKSFKIYPESIKLKLKLKSKKVSKQASKRFKIYSKSIKKDIPRALRILKTG